MDDRELLRQRFNCTFAHWEIELPVVAVSPGRVWFIVQRGWTIWTRFDISAEDGRECLDYYAMHRMTGDRHVRLYANGEEEDLPAMAGSYGYSEGATEAEKEAARGQVFRGQPSCGEAARREGLRHDRPSPRQRSGQPLLPVPPGRGRPLLPLRLQLRTEE